MKYKEEQKEKGSPGEKEMFRWLGEQSTFAKLYVPDTVFRPPFPCYQ